MFTTEKPKTEVHEVQEAPLICRDFEPDCLEVENPSHCHAGGTGRMPCCGIEFTIEPAQGICPLIG